MTRHRRLLPHESHSTSRCNCKLIMSAFTSAIKLVPRKCRLFRALSLNSPARPEEDFHNPRIGKFLEDTRMDVDRQTDLLEARMHDNWSFGSNYNICSQSRKISIGVLVDSISMMEPKDIKETVIRIAQNGSSSKENCFKDGKQHTSPVQKHWTAAPDTSPWVSTRSCNQKMFSAAAVHDAEHTPSFLVTSRSRPRSKLLEKASAAHSVKFFAGQTGLESDLCSGKNLGAEIHSVEIGNSNAEHLGNTVDSIEPKVLQEEVPAEDKTRNTETAGRETLRMKLWEVLENVSSPNRHCSDSQPIKFHPDQRDGKQSHIEKKNPNSDTIESDSDTHNFRRPVTRSLNRIRASTKNRPSKVVAPKSSKHKKERPEKRILPQKEDRSGIFSDNFNDCSLPCKRKKTGRLIRGGETHQVHKHGKVEERQKSQDKSRSVPAVEKLAVHEVISADRSGHRISDVFVEPKSSIKKKISEPPLNMMNEKLEDVEQPIDDVTVSKLKDQQGDKHHVFLGSKMNSVHNPLTSTFEIKSHGCLPERNAAKIQKSDEKVFNMKGVGSFRSLMSSIQAEPNMQLKSSDEGCKLMYSGLMKPSFIIQDDEDGRSISSTEVTDSEGSVNDSLMKGCQESKQLSLEIYIHDDFQHGSDKCAGHKKDVEGTDCTPVAESLKGIQDTSKLQMNVKQNHEDGLGRAVELFTVALARVKTKIKSVSNKRSSEILGAAAENILVLLQDAESHIKTDMGKVNNLTEQKRKRLETRFQALALNVSLAKLCYSFCCRTVSWLYVFAEKRVSAQRVQQRAFNGRDTAPTMTWALPEFIKAAWIILLFLSTSTNRVEGYSVTPFEQQDQLLGIYKKFAEEVDRHLQDYGGMIEDLEEHEIELKRYVERQRAAHRKALLQVEQGIKIQLDDAESRIMDVQELAKERMLQLKLVVNEFTFC
ncbi:hypothetical protein STAS_22854 [Striga asiatica]|uniref:Meiosis-specific protein ASY3-like coiled-coil domain-containing protein n=1 Tax=Striga asiatica TaxID=4170 RepID=A0A5A7QPN1_STRAF|nr:hypothetical protein STAS_22854 [Striga asiatica]